MTVVQQSVSKIIVSLIIVDCFLLALVLSLVVVDYMLVRFLF